MKLNFIGILLGIVVITQGVILSRIGDFFSVTEIDAEYLVCNTGGKTVHKVSVYTNGRCEVHRSDKLSGFYCNLRIKE